MNDTGKDLSSAQVPQDTPVPTPQAGSAFERWRRKAMLVTGLGVTEGERLENLKHDQIMHCERKKDYLMNYSACFEYILPGGNF
jgi:inner membrane protease ATP23